MGHTIKLMLAAVLALAVTAVALVLACFATFWRGLQRMLPKQAPRASSQPTAAECASAQPVVVAIHGTFAAQASWHLAGQWVNTQVQAHFTEPLLWYHLQWSGGNGMQDRADAVAELRNLLLPLLQAHPQRRVLLLGHSHGGNVALRMADELAAAHTGLCVATLGTPFLMAQHRPLGRLFGLVLPLFHAFGMAALVGVATVALAWPVWVAWALGLAALLLGMWVAWQQLQCLLRGDALIKSSMPAMAGLQQRLAARTFIVSRAGDEADGGLKLAGFLNQTVARLLREDRLHQEWDELERVAEAFAKEHPMGVPLNKLQWQQAVLKTWPQWLPVLRRFLGFGQLLPTLARFTLLGQVQMLQSVLRLAFGHGSMWEASQWLVSSSETPPGTWQHLQTLPSTANGASPLAHSQVYEDGVALRQLGQWLALQWAAAPGPTLD